ncbi:hypothetical protein NNC19_06700 [Clostridium sp. SHJSY1]|uniref:hypothetical protein n=1 Tax=Clostridium sp. SHJSY1 TaxID=2942483 RepID=UPI0028757095|nr:hypothetical protein [Clostridium sp. SHJSY1]MDS0525361.1 hypothetical protein [Clostridium sp. SHJSY1]
MKRFITFILIFILSITMVGCERVVGEVPLYLFDINEAVKTSNNFMKSLSNEDIEGANKYCRNETIDTDEVIKMRENKIDSYKIDFVSEGPNYSYIRYLLIRRNENNVRANLESLDLRVAKVDDSYLIDEVKTKGLKEVYKDKTSLRLLDEDTGKSQLLLRRRDMPKQVYPKEENIVLTEEDVPETDFSIVNIGFQGESIAMISSNGGNKLISLAKVNKLKQTVGEAESGDINIDENIERLLEKPIAENIVGYDMLKNVEIQKVLFSDDDGELIVQLKEKDKGTTIKIYRNPKGELLPLKLNVVFPNDKYSLDILRVTSAGVFIKSTALKEEKESEGVYLIDLKDLKVTKKDIED